MFFISTVTGSIGVADGLNYCLYSAMISSQWRFDRGTEWEVRQWNGQTEEDEQEEHWGGAQSPSSDINKQWQVTDTPGATLHI